MRERAGYSQPQRLKRQYRKPQRQAIPPNTM